jgi:hypothetical protein
MRRTVEQFAGKVRAHLRPPAPAGIEPPAPDAASPPERPEHRPLHQRVEEAIVDAQRRGEFDDLRGKGKPIPAELLFSRDDAWLAGKTLANAGFLPPWLQLQHEIDDDMQACRFLVERTERFPPLANRDLPMRELRRRLDEVRAKTRRYNLMVPTMSLQRPVPATEALLQRMARAAGQAPS